MLSNWYINEICLFFHRIVIQSLVSSFGVFEGTPGDLIFTNDLHALSTNKFYTAGKLTAWSIIHNGPGPQSLNRQAYMLMVGQKPDLTNINLNIFTDVEVRNNLQMVH